MFHTLKVIRTLAIWAGAAVAVALVPTSATQAQGPSPALPANANSYLCHMRMNPIKPILLSLQDEFGFYQAWARKLTHVCNPVANRWRDGSAEVVDKGLRLACYKLHIIGKDDSPWIVRIWNRLFPNGRTYKKFAPWRSRPSILCVPSKGQRIK